MPPVPPQVMTNGPSENVSPSLVWETLVDEMSE